MDRVKNAIILAAGRGTRLKHLTDELPKPLLSPKGKTFIEEIIKNLKEKGINNISIVTGYKSEKFDFLKENVKLIYNDQWDKGNNVTSIIAAINEIDNTLIINGDIIMNENVFQTEYESSITYVEKNKNIAEWIVNVDKNNNIESFDKIGLGKEGFYQREITFINTELSNKIKKEYHSFNKNEYQEYLVLNTAKKFNIKFKIFEIKPGKVFDLDTVEEFENYANKR